MSVVWLILKIIGFLLLALVGLLLLAVLSVLLVPVRYRIFGRVDEGDGVTVECRLSWLLHAVSYHILYLDKEFQKKLKILGISWGREGKSPKAEKEKKPKNKKDKKKIKEETSKETLDKDVSEDAVKVLSEDAAEVLSEDRADILPEDTNAGAEEIKPTGNETPLPETISNPTLKKPSRFRRFFKKIKTFPGMIKAKLETLKEKVRSIKDIISRICREWKDENNRSAVKLVWRELKSFLRHFLPKRAKVDAVFSTGEPDTTGQTLGLISLLPFIYRYKIRLLPDFESEKIYFRGTFDIRGHVHGIHAALLLYRLIKDKNIRSIIQRYRNS